jgi:D-sedoheptulose 7-phosphate isomerase
MSSSSPLKIATEHADISAIAPPIKAKPNMNARRPFAELLADRAGLLLEARYEQQVADISAAMVHAFRNGGKVLWFGNGGSAADAQHLAAEFSGRFLRERAALPSEALTVNTSAVTAIGNDFGYENVFSRMVEALAGPKDVIVGITTSGTSKNVVLGLEAAKKIGATTVAFTGNGGGKVAEIADLSLVGPDGYSAIIQEVHITFGHIICDLVEQELLLGQPAAI